MRMEEYLDVDKEEYLNRNEYNLDENSPDNIGYADESGDQKGFSNDAQFDMQNKYMDSQPIKEYAREEEMTATPQDNKHFETLFKKNSKFWENKWYLDPNFNDKLHLVWERERIQRNALDFKRMHDPLNYQGFRDDSEPAFSISTVRGKLFEYDFLRPLKKRREVVDNLKSSIPVLSDHYKNSKTHSSAALNTAKVLNKTWEEASKKKMKGFGNFKGPAGYKEIMSSFSGTPTDNFRAFPLVNQGRNRMFYSSQIF